MIQLDWLFSLIFLHLIISVEPISDSYFKCSTDGIFEDELDCRAFFECLWTGTALEKQEHVFCQSDLVFNPLKLRCDTIFEYKSQLIQNGIRTKQDLVQLIRFSNCIGQNLLQNLTKAASTMRSFRKILHHINSTTTTMRNKAEYLNSTTSTTSTTKSSILSDLRKKLETRIVSLPSIVDSYNLVNKLSLDKTVNRVKPGGIFYSRRLLSIEPETEQEESTPPATTESIKLKKKLEILKRYEMKRKTIKERAGRDLKPQGVKSTLEPDTTADIFTTTKGMKFVRLNTTLETPHMQTYRINQTKKLFAPLRMSQSYSSGGYDNVTKISEIERGGKFQRLRLAPADTLIECKENDFGLECSCSITLSPPKCKQLISSFLSSCRILGCKNNGKCINMAYKYPIPYVCSCPSGYMGSYCEISTEAIMERTSTPVSADMDSASDYSYESIGSSSSDQLIADNGDESARSMRLLANKENGLNEESQLVVEPTTSTPYYMQEYTTPVVQRDQFEFTSSAVPSFLAQISTTMAAITSLCEPNPCMNDGKCVITTKGFFECRCVNDSFSGEYCENFKKVIKLSTTTIRTTSSARSHMDYLITKPSTSMSSSTSSPSTSSSSTVVTTTALSQELIKKRRKWSNKCPSNCYYSLRRGFCRFSTVNNEPYCSCEPQWTGQDCGTRNYCWNNKCENNSTCFNFPGLKSYFCKCPEGLTGLRCETRLPELAKIKPMPRMFSSVVQLEQKNETKIVKESFDGSSKKNLCLSEKCHHNGTCVMSITPSADNPETNDYMFVCRCPEAYFGPLCEYKRDIVQLDASTTSTFQTTITSTTLSTTTTSTTTTTVSTTTTSTTTTSTTTTTTTPSTTTSTKETAKPQVARIINPSRSSEATEQSINTNSIFLDNPCEVDPDLCRKQPSGNDSYICVKSFITQDYTLCLPTKSLDCGTANPCLNNGICIEEDRPSSGGNASWRSWRCICGQKFTGNLCETEICSSVFQLFDNHTMCTDDSDRFNGGDVTASDIELIVDFHNAIRRQVAPIAANMQKMYWDVRLQQLAQKRAQSCSVDNINILHRQQPGYGVVIGENLAAGYEKWSHVLTSWASERKNFVFKPIKSGAPRASTNQHSAEAVENLQAGHYTQMIYSSAARIGCGFAECSNTTYDRYFVCYYGEMQTFHSRNEPYQDGKACSSCAGSCDDGLCDCKGVYCSNGGVLDLNSCTCKCPYPTFTGQYCENVLCPKEDSQFCSQALLEDKCWLYPVVRAMCPYMCSICNKFTGGLNSNFTFSQLNELRFNNLKELIKLL